MESLVVWLALCVFVCELIKGVAVETQIGCTTNSQCPADRTCVGQRCVDPCLDRCGLNAVCQVISHYPNCACIQGFTGNPIEGCEIRGQAECTTNDHCPADRTCVGQKCIDPCPNRCGPNAVCQVINHFPNCACFQGFAGNPVQGCVSQAQADCTSNDQCPADRTCVGQRCVDSCSDRCGVNAMCQIINHYPNCVCVQGFSGNPVIGCDSQEQPECSTNDQCPGDRACVGQKCMDPCLNRCGVNSLCKVVDHYPNCACDAGFIGNPLYGCEPQAQPECTKNDQCPADRACVDEKCVDPCLNRCGVNAMCIVTNHYANCVCNQGFTGNPGLGCELQAQPQCTTNEHCPANLNCMGQTCVDPCALRCGLNAICQVVNHYPQCVCQQGFNGNPLQGCAAQAPPECTTNDQCSANLTCVGQRCVDLCLHRCGANAICQVTNHYPACICIQGYTGNPVNGCETQAYTKGPWPPSTGKKKFEALTHTKYRWLGAYMYCLRHEKRLARIETEEEDRQAVEAIHRTGLRGQTFWIDGTDDAGEGLWYWVSTSKIFNMYENWDLKMPDNWGNHEHCLGYFEMDRRRGYKWNDRTCWDRFYFMCEYYE